MKFYNLRKQEKYQKPSLLVFQLSSLFYHNVLFVTKFMWVLLPKKKERNNYVRFILARNLFILKEHQIKIFVLINRQCKIAQNR
jgi:hypothetical protein